MAPAKTCHSRSQQGFRLCAVESPSRITLHPPKPAAAPSGPVPFTGTQDVGHCTFSGPPGFSPQFSAEVVHPPSFSCGSCEPLSDLDVHLQGFAHGALHPAVTFAPGEAEGSKLLPWGWGVRKSEARLQKTLDRKSHRVIPGGPRGP